MPFSNTVLRPQAVENAVQNGAFTHDKGQSAKEVCMQHCSTSNNNLSLSTVALAASIRDDKAGKSPEARVRSHASALLHFPGTLSNDCTSHNKHQHTCTCVLACLKRRLPHASPLNLWSKVRVGQKSVPTSCSCTYMFQTRLRQVRSTPTAVIANYILLHHVLCTLLLKL